MKKRIIYRIDRENHSQNNPPKLSLEDAFVAARKYSEEVMNKLGELRPTVFMVDDNGAPLLYVAGSIPGEGGKATWDKIIQLLCIVHAATAAVVASEIWRAPLGPDESLKNFVPAEQPDRTECVLLMGEALGAKKHIWLPIIRYDNGKFFGFGSPEVDSDEMSGLFTALLPRQAPNNETRAIARAMLAQLCNPQS